MERRLAAMDRFIQRMLLAARRWPSDMELSKQQLFLLKTLLDRSRATVGELAEQLSLSPSATTIAVSRLANLGLIERTRDESDRRLVWLQLTEDGKRKMLKFKAERDELLLGMLSRLTDEETDRLFELFEKMTNGFTKGSQEERSTT
ncbi:MarR family transcriptional regulator [Paenibacillus filicis]|uniref:MarR family transcriptional regulator n=1 Tax=Paenibacillus gyeongsangnamensis TaxID=3388067 RepID=A0ABT4Q527_9BACL|nr:MarR family transcriptional regulator [Paenibacillus filicis]MCZ8511977.1 MarR family transcriptional regulator [Paenibacillus filicis]